MTKEQFETIKSGDPRNITMEMWFEYYKERGGILSSINEFEKYFTAAIADQIVVPDTRGLMVRITLNSSFRNFCDYYDSKFN